jgi:hypothetical protein
MAIPIVFDNKFLTIFANLRYCRRWGRQIKAGRFLDQQSEELSFGLSQRQYAREPQQQCWFSCCLFCFEYSSSPELVNGNWLGASEKSPDLLRRCTSIHPKITRRSFSLVGQPNSCAIDTSANFWLKKSPSRHQVQGGLIWTSLNFKALNRV